MNAASFFYLYALTMASLQVYCSKPILWNEQIDFLFMWFDYASAIGNLTTVSIPDIVTDKITIRRGKLGNIATLTRDSDVFMEEPNADRMKMYGSFRLGKFKLMVDDFRYRNYAGSANFTSNKNSIKVSYSLVHHTKPGRCFTDWDIFKLAPFNKVIMYSNDKSFNYHDISEEVNRNILPELNKYMNSAKYKKKLNYALDFCFINIFK